MYVKITAVNLLRNLKVKTFRPAFVSFRKYARNRRSNEKNIYFDDKIKTVELLEVKNSKVLFAQTLVLIYFSSKYGIGLYAKKLTSLFLTHALKVNSMSNYFNLCFLREICKQMTNIIWLDSVRILCKRQQQNIAYLCFSSIF